MPRNIKEVVIIGDGFAAAVMVIHLLRRGVDPSMVKGVHITALTHFFV